MEYQQYLIFEIGNTCNLSSDHARCPITLPDRYGTLEKLAPLTDAIILESCNTSYKELGFKGLVGWHYYNEPLIDRDRILFLSTEIKKQNEQAKFILWTNGTHLNNDVRGLSIFNQIVISNYENLDLNWLHSLLPDTSIVIFKPSLDIRASCPKSTKATKCLIPFKELIIDYWGNGHICCFDFRGKTQLGNIWKDGFHKIVSTFLTIRDQLSQEILPENTPSYCKQCGMKQPKLQILVPSIAVTIRDYLNRTK